MRWLLLLVVMSACAKKATPVDAGLPLSPAGERVGERADASLGPSGEKGTPAALPDAGYRLAWISEASGEPQVVVNGTPLTSGAAHYLAAATSSRLYATRSESGTEQLFELNFDGGLRALGEPSLRARNVTTGGRVTLFESGIGGLSSIQRIDGDTLVAHEAGSFEPSLSPDGTWFAFVSSRDGDAEIYRASIDGGQLQRLTAFHLDDVAPKVSPDGKWIAFVSNREGQDRLFVVKPDGRGQRRLHSEPTQDTRWDAGEFEPAEADAVWTPDSKRIVFSSRGPRGYWHLFEADVATGALTRLTDGTWDDQLPALSPDGHWLAFVSSRDGNAEIYAMERGAPAQRVTFDPAADWKPAWVPRAGPQ